MFYCKIVSVIMCLVFLFSVTCYAEGVTVSSECDISDVDVPLSAEETSAAIGQTLEIGAKSVILMEVNTGRVLYESNADEKTPPASITKIMSLLLVMEEIAKGNITLETQVTASEHACSMGGSQIWLEPGETMTVDELLKATVIASANDACVALGELVAGSEEGFVAMMNARAKELGMNSTNFINCTGLDAEGHLTTAHDVAIASAELIKHELIKTYSTVWMDTLRGGQSELVNTNKLVRFYEGTTGLKTGTTSNAGYCLSATAERDGLELVAVVMSGESSNERFEGAKKLLNYGFANYTFSEIEAELSETEVKIKKGVKNKVMVEANEKLKLLLEKTSAKEVTQTTEFNEDITAPVREGDTVGFVNVYVGDELVGRIEITAAETVEKVTPLVTFMMILGGMFKL